ncbi:MAG TPA: MarR family transcriptional regulator [Acidimicrobiales bacterium]|nr:MarR family transcriptional regulator [Acidimicrobiales bacterium]
MPAEPYQLDLDEQLCFALYTACHAVIRAYRPLLAAAELTYPQYLTLLALWQDPAEPQAVGTLGHRLHMDTGTLTPLLKRLESAGLVTRRRDPRDERRVLVGVTDEGLALRERVASVPEALAACVGLDPDSAARLRDELVELVAAVDAAVPAGATDRPRRKGVAS